MTQLPEGNVTFLFTDVEASTRLWEDAPDVMMEALRLHDDAIDSAVAAEGGVSVKPRGEGDSRFIVFRSAQDAVNAVVEMQRRLASVTWPTPRPVRVRASLHTGLADLELGDYYGSAVNRAARLRAIAHGGQTVMSAATYDLVRDQLPDDLSVTDKGWHRLKDLTRPEHVFQLDIAGLNASFPPLKSLDSVPNNLPEQMTELIGREGELARIEDLLHDNRLVTILAPGGTGKSHLAIQAAANLTANYPDGVYFVALANISASDEIVQAVAETVGVALSSREDPRSQLLEFLTPRTQLLIFDNFEHVTGGAPIVSTILEATSGIDVIATSRSRLGLTGEVVLSLEGLDTSWTTAEQALKTSGVRLFMDAARRSKPDIALDDKDLAPLAEILRLTGGMPLGVLLAAAWVDMLSIADIAAEIAKNLDFLESSDVDVPERHRSVRAAFQYSWDLLSGAEQMTFAALSIFRGGFSREAAEAVAGASLRDLASLARKSLLRADPDTARYSVHELLRQFAEGELAEDPERQTLVMQAHGDYYAELARIGFGLFHSPDQVRTMEILEPDLDNLRLAWRHHVDTANPARLGQMVGAIWCSHELRGWYHAGLALLDPALDRIQDGSDLPDVAGFRARALTVDAAFQAVLGRHNVADTASAQAVSTARVSEDRECLLLALHLRAQTLIYLGRIAEVPSIIDEAVALGEASGDWAVGRFWAAGMKNLKAFALLSSGDVVSAAQLLDESRALLEPAGELFYMSWNYSHRARIAMSEGRVDDAIGLFSGSADRARRFGALRTLQISLFGLGNARLAGGDLEGAQQAFVESLGAAERTGMVPEMLATVVRVARTLAARGETRRAAELLAMVESEPDSESRLITERETVGATASAALTELEPDLGPEELAAVRSRGAGQQYRNIVKQLLGTMGESEPNATIE
ncbi:MAG: adenylate/guanylate cyclase domain-containing protein [Acidimicrobiia bacterium]